MEIVEYDCEKYKSKKIVVYGIREMGYITLRCLQELDVPVYCFADRVASYHALFGNVISLEEILALAEKEDVVILFAIRGYARSEAEYLYQSGIKRIYSVRKLWKEADVYHMDWNDACQEIIDKADMIFFTEDTIIDPQKLYLYTLDAVVTERCSLKCQDCANLMQYYQNPRNMDILELKRSIDNILRKECRIFDLRILGGEPLMNKEFIKIVDWYHDEERIERISIYSNATIFPDDGILEHLKRDKVYIRLSDYGSYSYKLEEWVQWCRENNIRCEVAKIESWQECGRLERHDYSESELMGIYSRCECRNLPTIMRGYLYNCPYAANAANLGAMISDEMCRDRLLLTDSVSEKEIDEFLYGRKYLEACRYCRGRNYRQAEIPPYVQTRQPLTYKKMSNVQMTDTDFERDNEIGIQREQISVVIPVYNAEEYVERCLVSVLESSYQNIEVIVVDDGSVDGTLRKCRKIAEGDTSNRVRIIENEHGGVVKTRNTGILAAKGKYITFVDADDYIDVDRISAMAKAIDDCDLVYAGHMTLHEDMQINDRLMDRGQSKLEVVPCSVSEGVYEGAALKAFIKRSFKSFWQGYNMVGRSLWQYIFKSDMLKEICEKVNPSIWYYEDAVLLHLYTSLCNRIRVIKNFGYYYYLHKQQKNRYSLEKVMANAENVYYCQYNGLKSKLGFYGSFLWEEYVEYLIAGLHMQEKGGSSIRSIYYPYYGRLKGKKVILYGAGNVGKAYYRHIKDDHECLLLAWVDKNAERLRRSDLLPVEDVECLYHIEYDYIVIAVFDEIVYHNIRRELVATGIKEESIIWNPTRYEW